jgi:iron complex transport system ATP-binding protein
VPHAVRLLWGPDNRQLLLNGDDVARMRQRDVARRVAVVQQDPLLPPAFTAMEAVLMGRTPYLRLLQNEGPSDYEAARRAMVVTGVWALADRRLGELSGGERQRVVVARVLAQDTPVLLLDEPTAHLDIRHQASVLGLLRALCREGKAVLAVADDLTLAGQYCDWLVVLQGGRVAACGAPQEVLRAELLHPVYGAAVDVFPHPRTGMPVGWH